MVDLACPNCGVHLELGLVVAGLQDTNSTESQGGSDKSAIQSANEEAIQWAAEQDDADWPGIRMRLRGQVIVVRRSVLQEALLALPDGLPFISRYSCHWYVDGVRTQDYSVRGALLTYLEAEYSHTDWQTKGITTNDARRIIARIPGFAVLDHKTGAIQYH